MRSPLLTTLAAAAVILASGPASGDADGPDFFAVTGVDRGDVLDIREEPGAHASKVGGIPPDGSCVRNLGCTGGLSFQELTELSPAEQERRLKQNPRWCKVEYRGIMGWVAGRYLREGNCPESQR
jgi:hypothetical protein